jgi:hypothetical protein
VLRRAAIAADSPFCAQVLSLAAAATVSLSMASASFAEGSTVPALIDDTKKNAGVQLIYEVRFLSASRCCAAGEAVGTIVGPDMKASPSRFCVPTRTVRAAAPRL